MVVQTFMLQLEQTSEPGYLHILYLTLGGLGGVVAVLVILLLRQRVRGTHFPYWVRFFWEFPLGVVAAAVAFYLSHHNLDDFFHSGIGEALIHTLFVVLVIELVRTAHSLEQAGLKLHKLEECVINDQRIILARNEPFADRREISVVGVERLDSRQLPIKPLVPPPSPAEKWALTISVLRVDRLQDLLFSSEYLKHFLTLHACTKKQYRILIINDQPRSEAAVRSFLQMSETQEIRTYVYLKGEFYRMLDCVDRRLARTKAEEIRRIMEGQPDLSLMQDDSEERAPSPITEADNYLLRFRHEGVEEFGKHIGRPMNVSFVDCVHRLMHAAIREGGREGLANLQAVLGNSVSNPWKCDERLAFLKTI